MRLFILTVSLWLTMALVYARPEMYKEKEDFQYSRSSSDDGSKSGFYGAQRGNMGGNFEKAHNMDSLAQHQMSTLVRQVDGELGDGANTRTGSVFTAGNSRGIYGSGNYDLSNLKGRTFDEGVTYGDTHSSSSLSGANSARFSSSQLRRSGHSSGYDAAALASQYAQSNDQQVGSQYQESSNYEYGQQGASQYKYVSRGGSQASSDYDLSKTDSQSGSNYDANVRSRLISTTPVRVYYIRPGTRVAIPVGAQTYDSFHSSLSQDQSVMNSEAEILNSGHRTNVVKPVNNAKHYESSYSYRKEWERNNAQPKTVLPTENPFPINSELYEDAQLGQASGQQYHSELDSSNAQSSNSNSILASNYDSAYSSGFNSNSRTAASNRMRFVSQTHNSAADTASNAYAVDSHNTGSSASANLNSLVDGNSRPKSYQSSYSYHKSWERQGDPYVIKPMGVDLPSHTSQRLTADHTFQDCCKDYRREKRSYDPTQYQQYMFQPNQDIYEGQQESNQQLMDNWADLGQQVNGQWDNLEKVGQNQIENLEDLGQQSQNPWDNLQNFGQQTQNEAEKLEDLGQQAQNTWDEFGQQTQDQTGRFEDLGQQSQNTWDNLQNFGQQTQHQIGKLEDLGQQTQNTWGNLENFSQQTQDQIGKLEDLGQQTQNSWGNLENFSQQTQDQTGKLEDLSQQTQDKTQKLEDLGQQTQNTWGNLENFSQQTQDQTGKLGDLSQQTQDKTEKLEDLGQQTQNSWGNLENFSQQTQNELNQNKWHKVDQETRNTEGPLQTSNIEEIEQQNQNIIDYLQNMQDYHKQWSDINNYTNIHQQTQVSFNQENTNSLHGTQNHWDQESHHQQDFHQDVTNIAEQNLWDAVDKLIADSEKHDNETKKEKINNDGQFMETTTKIFQPIAGTTTTEKMYVNPKLTIAEGKNDKNEQQDSIISSSINKPSDVGRGDIGPDDLPNEKSDENTESGILHEVPLDKKLLNLTHPVVLEVVGIEQQHNLITTSTPKPNENIHSHKYSDQEQDNLNFHQGSDTIEQQYWEKYFENSHHTSNWGDLSVVDFSQQAHIPEVNNIDQQFTNFGQTNDWEHNFQGLNKNIQQSTQEQNFEQQFVNLQQANNDQTLQNFDQQAQIPKESMNENFQQSTQEQNFEQQFVNFQQANNDQTLLNFDQQAQIPKERMNENIQQSSQHSLDQFEISEDTNIQKHYSNDQQSISQSVSRLEILPKKENSQATNNDNRQDIDHNNSLGGTNKKESPKTENKPEEPIEVDTDKTGFWESIWSKTVNAKDKVVSWFKN